MAQHSFLATVTMHRIASLTALFLWMTALAAQEAPVPYPFVPTTQQQLQHSYFRNYDLEYGGWPDYGGKRLRWPSLAYALNHSPQDHRLSFMASQTLQAARALQDAQGTWVSRSNSADWQTRDLRTANLRATTEALQIYAVASRWFPGAYTELLASTKTHLLGLREESGAFRTAADTPPRARDTAQAVQALLALYLLDDSPDLRTQAEQSLRWAMSQYRMPEGGFRHPETDQLELEDTQAMAQALFDLHLATGLPAWLAEAEQALNQVGEQLRDLRGGFVAAADSELRPWQANVGVAQVAAQLYHATHNMRYRSLAEHALRFLAADFDPATCPGNRQHDLLYLDELLQQNPPRYIIVGHRDDPAALRLYQAALRLPLLHRRLEWWDRRETASAPDLALPVLDHAAAYRCAPECSPPLTQPELLLPATPQP